MRSLWSTLLVCAAVAYLGMLIEGRIARAHVANTIVYGATLTADGREPVNTLLDASNGSASVGVNYRVRSSVRWTVVPDRTDASATRWLYVMAEDPQFFGPAGSLRVFVGRELVGEIRAAPRAATSFVPDPHVRQLRMPPAATYGYRFPLRAGNACRNAPCDVTVDGTSMFWHVFRVAIVGESRRFAPTRW